jgi:maltose O-acetyltransferase
MIIDAPPATGQPGRTIALLRVVRRGVRAPLALLTRVRTRLALRRVDIAPFSVRVNGSVRVANWHRIELGERVHIDATTLPVEIESFGGLLTIGDGTYINYGTSIWARAGVSIGRNCLIGQHVIVMDSDYHGVYDHSLAGKAAPIVIEDDVWLAARSTVLKGVHIGRGAVVAAGAVVTKDVPPRTLVAGVPARVVRAL